MGAMTAYPCGLAAAESSNFLLGFLSSENSLLLAYAGWMVVVVVIGQGQMFGRGWESMQQREGKAAGQESHLRTSRPISNGILIFLGGPPSTTSLQTISSFLPGPLFKPGGDVGKLAPPKPISGVSKSVIAPINWKSQGPHA